MRTTRIIFIGIKCLLISWFVKIDVAAQETRAVITPISAYADVIAPGTVKRTYEAAKNNKNELQQAFAGLFLVYKTVLSSQDQAVCTFSPSCSEYGIMAVKRFGTVKGGIMTLDRLTRCNGLSPEKYSIDPKTQLLRDNPDNEPSVPAETFKK